MAIQGGAVHDPIEGKYEILQKIQEGGMGAIYKVRHRLLEEVHVLKTMRPQHAGDRELEERFLREAKTAIKLRHPNIAQIYDFSVDADGNSYIVMEYIDGVTFEDVIRSGRRPSLGLSLELARQALDALDYLHGQDFVHRDIAPDNLMVASDYASKPQVKLIDLGIAKGVGGEGLTRTGTFLGKIRYSSPEQFDAAGAVKLDPRSDLYSFGVLLYELLTGRCPIASGSVSEVIGSHLTHPPLAFERSDPDGRVPEGLRKVVLRTLAKRPEDRFPTAAALSQALAPFRPSTELPFGELAGLIEAARLEESRPSAKSDPGSTQARLDGQFVSDPHHSTTVVVPVETGGTRSAMTPPQIAEAAQAITREIEGGLVEQARRMLDFARLRFGDHPEFDRLAARLG